MMQGSKPRLYLIKVPIELELSMKNEKPFVLHDLAPEAHLVASLPPKWKQRFEFAMASMEKMLFEGNSLTWEEIAKQSAISPHHFHRMFALVFNETPGQYLSRKRLGWAVDLMISEPTLTVTEVALEAGFSSSQALAKALKRSLGLTAKEIKQKQNQLDFFDDLMRRLGQPMKMLQQSLEEKMAAKIGFEVREYPSRSLVTKGLSTSSITKMYKVWCEIKPKGEGLAMVNLMQLSIKDQQVDVGQFEVGYFCQRPEQANLILEAGSYLCGRVKVNNFSAYFSAWDALFMYLLTHDLFIDDNTKCIDVIEKPESLLWEDTELIISVRLIN